MSAFEWVLVIQPLSQYPGCSATTPAGVSMVCDCLRADPVDALWGGGELGPIAETCFAFDFVMSMSPLVDQALRPDLERKAATILGRRGWRVEDETLVSQKDSEQFDKWLTLVEVEGGWEVVDPLGVLIAPLSLDKPAPVDVWTADPDEDGVLDLVLTLDDGQLWVAYGPLDPSVLWTPPK